MSGSVNEDTMEVDEDLRMDEDPTGTPMSTDDDSAQDAGPIMKDDVMASPPNESPSDMDADTVTSPPPLETRGAPKPVESEAAPDSTVADPTAVATELDSSAEEGLNKSQEDAPGDSNARPDNDQDPLLEGNSNSRTDLGEKETSNMSNATQDGQDPFAVSANENSQAEPQSSSSGKSLAEELAEARESGDAPKCPEDADPKEAGTSLANEHPGTTEKAGDNQEDVPDHISLSGSSNADNADAPDHVSIAGSSEADEGASGHVSVDSDSEADTGQSKCENEAQPTGSTDNDAQALPKNDSKSRDSKQAPTLQLKHIASLQAPSLLSDDVTSPSESTPVAAEKFRGSITLLGKQADSEMIISDGPPITPGNRALDGAPPSLPFSSDQQHVVSGTESRVGASIKAHYSVKKINNAVFSKCLHCASDQRCPWKVTIGAKDHYICSDKCIEEHRVQRRQILESGAPPLSTIIQIADLSSAAKKCAACKKIIPKMKMGCLTWEVMDFCDEECLTNYQLVNTSKCCNCQILVNTSSMGKYCVRFGHEVKQFCSPACLDTYKKGVKTCSYCQKNLQDSGEGFLAAVGGKDQFRDFCSQDCLEKYDCICNNACASFTVDNCVVCDNTKVTFYELLTGDKVAALCSDVCLSAYKFVNSIQVGVCGMCNKYYDKNSVDESITFHHDVPSSFCSKHCMNISVISKRKIVPCAWCKAKKYNFDMIYKRGATDDDGMFVCSVNCLALHNVSLKSLPSAKTTCAYCKKLEVSTYHLTMSDATVRHFCCYDCVLAFQAPFNTSMVNTNQPVPTGVPKKVVVPPAAGTLNPGPTIQSVGTLKAVEPSTLTPTSSPKTTPAAASKVKHTTLKIPASFCLKPPDMKNKWTQISVISLTKGVSCRPKKEDRDTQCSLGDEPSTVTDDLAAKTDNEKTPESNEKSVVASNKVFVPIPVPIYIPYPAAMYTLPSPVPLAVPVPVVVPVIVPTALDNMDQVIATMKDILEKSGRGEALSSKLSSKSIEGCNESGMTDKSDSRKRGFNTEEGANDEKSTKRSRLTEGTEDGDAESGRSKLKYKLGVSTWKHFVKRWNESIDDPEHPQLKADLLAMRPPELSSALSLFMREAKKDTGSPYRPDLKFYLALGIQYYLFRNKRPDDIFGDASYEEFTDVLDEEAQKFHSSVDPPVSRVEEQHLWESMQLGAKSPQALLTTLVYFITLRFNLWTIEEHMQLSFSSFVQTHKTSSSGSKSSETKVIRLSLNDSSDKKQVLELVENKQDPLRCPVRLYEFYLTKCPAVVTGHDDRFYLMPESSCVPESPVWYRSLALPPQSVEKMLNRVKLIKEICEARREFLEETADAVVNA